MLALFAALAILGAVGMGVLAYVFRDPPNERPEVARSLYSTVAALGDGDLVDLAEAAPFPWERVYIFPAYTADDDVDAAIGIAWGTGQTLRLPNDGFTLLVFVDGAAVSGWVVLNDYEADGLVYFGDQLMSSSVLRREAVFELHGDTLELRGSGSTTAPPKQSSTR